MRILIAHSRYRSGDSSGENRIVESEIRLLRDGGHDVVAWCPEPSRESGAALLGTGVGAIWSSSAVRRVRSFVRERRTEVVHVHNLFPALSPAVIRAASSAGAAVVVTLHNYRLLCLPATFLRDGRICEDCLGRIPWPGVVHRCYRGSLAGSGVLAASLALHRAIASFDRVDLFLAVSAFVAKKHVEAGLDHDRVVVRPSYVPPGPRREGPGDHFLYLGRLSPEKGVATLLAAHRPEHPPLVVVGDGPQRGDLEPLGGANVRFTGAVGASEVPALLAQTRALVLPSRCYEGAPRAVLEAYAAGVPVVASRVGALPELVEDGASGLLLPPGDEAAWRSAFERLASDAECFRLGVRAGELWRERYTPEHGLRSLEAAYATALERRRARTARRELSRL